MISNLCSLPFPLPSADDLTGSETILIVEDDDALRNLGREILEPQGYRILEAENGIEALRINEEDGGQIHLMITDVVMPKMGGKEVADRLQPLYPQMKVLYMSGYTDNSIPWLPHYSLSPRPLSMFKIILCCFSIICIL